MATAMHEATASKSQSVAEEMFWSLVPYPHTPGADEKLYTLVEVCSKEVEAVVQAAAPDQWCFGVAVTVCGHWAIKAAKQISMEDFPKTKLRLCSYIADAWMGTRELEEEHFFAAALRKWPAKEAKRAADAVRQIIEFRANGSDDIKQRLGRFFATRLSPSNEVEGDEVWRAIFKAIGRYADMPDCIIMGKVYHILQNGGEKASELRDFIGRATGV